MILFRGAGLNIQIIQNQSNLGLVEIKLKVDRMPKLNLVSYGKKGNQRCKDIYFIKPTKSNNVCASKNLISNQTGAVWTESTNCGYNFRQVQKTIAELL